MSQLDFLLLRAPEIRHGGQPLRFRSRKVFALLVYIAVAGGKHRRKELAQLLWPDSDASRGYAALRNTLRHLRDTLSEGEGQAHVPHLLVDDDMIAFDISAGTSFDMQLVDAAYRVAQSASIGGLAPAERNVLLAQFQAAIDSYHGGFLQGFELDDAPDFEEWVMERRSAWHHRVDLIFDRLVQIQFDSGALTDVLRTTTRWIAHDPLNEEAHRRLMRTHLLTGDRAAATRAYDNCVEILREELDIEPEPQTIALAEQIRTGASSAPPALAVQHRSQQPDLVSRRNDAEAFEIPFVGRVTEYAELIGAFETMRRGMPHVALVRGAAGSGKTRLLAEFRAWATAQGADVLSASAWEHGGRLPYQPVLDALRPRVERERAPDDLLDDVWLTELSQLLPELRERYPDLPTASPNVASGDSRLFEAITRLLLSLAQGTPILLCIDDVQWADSTSRNLLHYVLRRCRENATPLMLLLAVHTHERDPSQEDGPAPDNDLEAWLAVFRRDPRAHTFLLHPLTLADMLALSMTFAPLSFRDQEGNGPFLPVLLRQFSEWLLAQSNGYPARIAELFELIRQRDMLVWQGASNSWAINFQAVLNERADLHLSRGASPTDVPTSGPSTSSVASTEGLLATKLFLPPANPQLVTRPRLTRHLDTALAHKLTLVIAPPGFGKTTLLSTWIAENVERHDRVAWVALDGGDNDVARFWTYVAAALDTIAPGTGAAAITLLQAPQPPRIETVLTNLLNALSTLATDAVLVLDDYHVIDAQPIHQGMVFMLEHLPPRLHIILLSRTEPPLPLARLRGRRALGEIRAADLRFTPDEAATFLHEVMGLSLAPDEVNALEMRTEGWIAGLQLAALAMRNHADVGGFIAAFTGNHRFVMEYLVEEVLARQPAHIQTFLLHTSILDRMCGSLCDAVLGIGDASDESNHATGSTQRAFSQMLLEELERGNLFIVPLDDEGRWYRYHHLFAEVLRYRLDQGAKREDIAMLHQRASSWYESQGLIAEAVPHAQAAGDWEHVARLLEVHGPVLATHGQLATFLTALGMIPQAVEQAHPLLAAYHGAALIIGNQPEMAEQRLQQVERSSEANLPDDLRSALKGFVAILRGNLLYFVGDLAQAISLAQHGLALLPAATTSTTAAIAAAVARSTGAVFAGTAYKLSGNVTAASEQLAAATIAPMRATGNLIATLNSYTYLAYLQTLQGRLHAAAATYAEAERSVPIPEMLDSLPCSASYYFGMGDLLREWNDLDAAEWYLRRGMELVQGTLANDGDVILRGYVAAAHFHQAVGNDDAALATIDAFADVARQRKLVHPLIVQAAATRARLLLQQGNFGAASAWADSSGLDPDDALDFQREGEYLTLARVRIAEGSSDAVLPLLERLGEDAEAKARTHSLLETLRLRALVLQAQGNTMAGVTALERALALAEPEGYIRSFVDEGPAMVTLLLKAQTHGIWPHYVDKLLRAYSATEVERQRTLDQIEHR